MSPTRRDVLRSIAGATVALSPLAAVALPATVQAEPDLPSIDGFLFGTASDGANTCCRFALDGNELMVRITEGLDANDNPIDGQTRVIVLPPDVARDLNAMMTGRT